MWRRCDPPRVRLHPKPIWKQDTPDGVVHDAYVAFLRRDTTRMKSYFSQRVQENFDRDKRWPEIEYYPDTNSRRMRIASVEMQGDD